MVFVTYFWEFSKIMGRKIKETIQIMSYLNPSGVFWLVLMVFVHLINQVLSLHFHYCTFGKLIPTRVSRIAISS